eukprot:CAMPEP_0206275616 /NCGR_PEP_ID=MMETSP0047_2-20121206/35854_1 /ASSEMBLY_ACC=CAM_ASM_000192 /TAXON_ID=195065 /ORGANISM="Chroomonas mesostigmatica_cf, Strain CCMP1168" /LENGTH=60 /DNA_ID=CAMNT_0053705051 /DNA_START=35 /DNA_END=214 /DNA_ORIENTATION=+
MCSNPSDSSPTRTPGAPLHQENGARTESGGITEPSSILQQSLMMQRFPMTQFLPTDTNDP